MLKFFCFLVKTPRSHGCVVFLSFPLSWYRYNASLFDFFCFASQMQVCPNMSLLKDAHSVPGISRKNLHIRGTKIAFW
ncbi:hypothetical protein DER45DRAFT_181518 [Fusarium avenaceum]|nr:hypothetical protein DER45DRAFT_181518 [Fusarium avenaceum]